MANFTFGTDPEFVLMGQAGEPVSAIGVVPGTKDKRYLVDRFSYYYDNVLAECTVPPTGSRSESIETMRQCLSRFSKIVAPRRLAVRASARYPASQLQHKHALEIGCDPEFCAYTLTQPEPPKDKVVNSPLRSAGGHIHVGHAIPRDPYGCLHTVRMLDLFVGIPSVFLDTDPTALARKELYGQAGRFRQPPHGVEYRSLSNFWLATPARFGLIYDLCDAALNFLEAGKHESLWKIDFDKINNGDWSDPTFDLASCHHCMGYDVKALRHAINAYDTAAAEPLLFLLYKLIPSKLANELQTAIDAAQAVKRGEAKVGTVAEEWGL